MPSPAAPAAPAATPRPSHHRFATLFRLSPLPIALVSYRDGRFLEVNGAFERQLGYSRKRTVGRTAVDMGLWCDLQDRRRFRARLARRRRVEGHRVRLLTSAGLERSVELAAERLDLDGQGCILVVGRDVTAELEAEDRLVTQAFYDSLTGLPNRQLCEERMEHALAVARQTGSRTAVFFIDLDRMKSVNDTLGHRAGDELLLAASVRLRQALRPCDLLARFGGDELVAVAQVGDEAEALKLGNRLRARMAEPLEASDRALRVTASIGVAVADPGTRDRPSDLLRFADVAMYRAKRAGGDGVQMFDPHLDGEQIRDLEIRGALAVAVERGELELHYQPIVWLSDLSPWGAEALLRWKHPQLGYVSPSRFIPIAEATGMIVPIGRWVLGEACRQLADWRRRGRVAQDFVVSVNVSARQLTSGDFADQVASVLRETGLRAHCLQIEVTERLALDAPESVPALHALGVRLAIDDFGEGYGSLGYLRQLPVDTLKVEHSFTRDLTRDPVGLGIVRAIVYLADVLGKQVVAEGIETPEQLRCLREMGCTLGQGFLFAQALTAEQLERVAAGRRPQREAA